jgi:hypothetical protein
MKDTDERSCASRGSVGEGWLRQQIARVKEEMRQLPAWCGGCGGWIPVTERLPELRKVVLGYSDEWEIPFAVLEYFGGRDPWVDAEGFFAEPTHWQPLQAPPTESK